jgi:hypothetical protein
VLIMSQSSEPRPKGLRLGEGEDAASVRERPILFSAPMVRALLAGRKTQTRRVLTQNNSTVLGERWGRASPWSGLDFSRGVPRTQSSIMCYIAGADAPRDVHLDVPFLHPQDAASGMDWDGVVYRVRPQWQADETLWVRESLTVRNDGSRAVPKLVPMYAADWEGFDKPDRDWDWTPSIHMPRWASRITLRITDVRVERLNDISEADALAEGIERIRFPEVGEWGWPQRKYRDLWEVINGPGSWDANPWVWAMSFEVATPAIGASPAGQGVPQEAISPPPGCVP